MALRNRSTREGPGGEPRTSSSKISDEKRKMVAGIT